MKKQGIPILIVLTVAFAAFTLGFFLGRNHPSEPVTLSIPVSMQTVPPETTAAKIEESFPALTVSFPIDINRAGKEEIMALPGIGENLALRILSYREKHGSFSRVEELLNVEGIGKKRFEEILDLIIILGG